MDVRDLGAYGGTEQLIKALSGAGYDTLFPPQEQAVRAGLLAGRNSWVVAAPTASGKTLIAEMAALQILLEKGGKVVYLVPLRALAREKFEGFSSKYQALGIRVAQSTGDFDDTGSRLAQADLIVATNEKFDSLLRHRSSWTGDVALVVADEIHLLGDPHRGPTLEILLSHLRWFKPHVRIIALSATVANAPEVAQWLGARLIESDWRPVPLREGVYFDKTVTFSDGTVRPVLSEYQGPIALALEVVRQEGQALVFINTRRGTETFGGRAACAVSRLLNPEDRKSLKMTSEQILSSSAEPTRVCRKLAYCVGRGVAFHHAGITGSQRKLVEDAFRANRIRLVAATTTLAMGLNLPARLVIIRDWWRFEGGSGWHPLPVLEVKQMAGRAGRPGRDSCGEAVLVAQNPRDQHYLFETYVNGNPEKTASRLGLEATLRAHVLASIAGAYANSREDILGFLQQSFFAFQQESEHLPQIVERIISFLIREGMLMATVKGLVATNFGRRIAELYIDPQTGVLFRQALHRPEEKMTFPLLHMTAKMPEMRRLALRKNEVDGMVKLLAAWRSSLLIPEEERAGTENLLAELKTAALLQEWIEETSEDAIVERFGVGPGDIRTLVHMAEWLLYAAGEIAGVFQLADAAKTLARLRIRVAGGIREELLALVALRGIGRVRARNLFKAGYRTLAHLKRATLAELAKVRTVGEGVAKSIKQQVQVDDSPTSCDE